MVYPTNQDDFELGTIPLAATATGYTGNTTAGALSRSGEATVTLVQNKALQVTLEVDNATRISSAGTHAVSCFDSRTCIFLATEWFFLVKVSFSYI